MDPSNPKAIATIPTIRWHHSEVMKWGSLRARVGGFLVNTRTDRIEIFVEAVARIYDFVGESRKAEKSEL